MWKMFDEKKVNFYRSSTEFYFMVPYSWNISTYMY